MLYSVSLVFVRNNDIGLQNLVVISFSTFLMNEQLVMDALKKSVQEWMENTEDGKRANTYTNGDYNIGDLISEPLESIRPFLEKNKIMDFTVLFEFYENNQFSYDTVLGRLNE